jgi:hypothetical protein
MDLKMDHDKIREIISLSLYNELTDTEKILLQEHLSQCDSCKREYEEIKKIEGLLTNLKLPEIDNKLLQDARYELRAAIRKEKFKYSFLENLLGNLNLFLIKKYRLAFSGIALILVGVGIGYLLFMNKDVSEINHFINASNVDTFEKNNIKIKNLRFLESNEDNGEISFTFEAARQVSMKGKINDLIIQKILAQSLLNDQNDGVRLKALNAISAQTAIKLPGKKVKAALITAMKYDGNAGVRMEALNVLKKYSSAEDVIEALLYVLKNDSNSGLRVAAINSLSQLNITEKEISPELLELLKQKSQNDENQYVRIRAKSILQEVYQQ